MVAEMGRLLGIDSRPAPARRGSFRDAQGAFGPAWLMIAGKGDAMASMGEATAGEQGRVEGYPGPAAPNLARERRSTCAHGDASLGCEGGRIGTPVSLAARQFAKQPTSAPWLNGRQ